LMPHTYDSQMVGTQVVQTASGYRASQSHSYRQFRGLNLD
jgi:hypothetical protein